MLQSRCQTHKHSCSNCLPRTNVAPAADRSTQCATVVIDQVSRSVQLGVEVRREKQQQSAERETYKSETYTKNKLRSKQQELIECHRTPNSDEMSTPLQQQYHEQDVTAALREIHLNTQDVLNRQDIAQEAHYLQVVISELRDKSQLRKIFGIGAKDVPQSIGVAANTLVLMPLQWSIRNC